MDPPKKMVQRVRTSVICLSERRLLVIELRDPKTGQQFWTVPGGAIEPGETIPEAAARETLEETGYRVSPVSGSLLETRYPFLWDGILYDCTTYWLLAPLVDPAEPPGPVDDASYLLRARWLPVQEAPRTFAYHSAIRDAVLRLIAAAGEPLSL